MNNSISKDQHRYFPVLLFNPRMTALSLTIRTVLLGGVILAAIAGCQSEAPMQATESIAAPPVDAPAAEPYPPLPWVEVNGSDFLVDGAPYRFIGANTTTFGFYEQYHLSIEDAIRQAKETGISVIRIYLGLGTGPWGARPIEEYDRVLDLAGRNQMYVIAVITDCCCVGTDWGPTLDEYLKAAPYCNFSDPSSLSAFKEYIKETLTRTNTVNGKVYREDSTIMAWDLMNEPLLAQFSREETRNYLEAAVSFTKSIDPHHLVTLGIDASSRRYDNGGVHYELLNIPGLDFFSFHYNLNNYHSVPQKLEGLTNRVEILAAMGKPVVLEEFGVGSQRSLGLNPAPSVLQAWADSYRLQMDAAFSAGASGVMFWGWGVPETSEVPLWWNNEDHDITEIEFCQMIREYEIPSQP